MSGGRRHSTGASFVPGGVWRTPAPPSPVLRRKKSYGYYEAGGKWSLLIVITWYISWRVNVRNIIDHHVRYGRAEKN
jgi:hypothetical protein